MSVFYDVTRFEPEDIYFFKEGTHSRLYDCFGAHPMQREGEAGYYFAVWAPNASEVSVVGDFNGYDPSRHPLRWREDGSGIWEGFIPGVNAGQTYKFRIRSHLQGRVLEKADPFAFYAEEAPKSASRTWSLDGFDWNDGAWMASRREYNHHRAPVAIYEVHLGSWRRGEGNRVLSYTEAAQELAVYLKKMNYTHVELMPITEFPFEGSWGYQVTGYFAPTARYGDPQAFMAFVDIMHANGIGVILDWVPSHFVTDGHGLINFDGTCLYEHEDPRQGFHPEWGSAIFNYDRNEVRAFLISSAMYWLERYHIDGIRVDAVASMLYLNYARKEGEWVPNAEGGNLNLGAIRFLRQLNESVYGRFDDIMMIAEESTAFPKVSGAVSDGGLGFGYKWNMGWMHDTLKYFKKDAVYRRHHHHELTFSFVYMFDENYVLPLSHDEVVHMKGSLIGKMPGDANQKFAQLRTLLAFMTAFPGKKLLFMGGEFGQYAEWNYKQSLDWHLLAYDDHAGLNRMVADLNGLYRSERALHYFDTEPEGFEWVDELDYSRNVIAFMRKSEAESIIVVCHFADALYDNYCLGVSEAGSYEVIFDSQEKAYAGWNGMKGAVLQTQPHSCHGREHALTFDLRHFSVLYLKRVG